jgi:hypothetical protein
MSEEVLKRIATLEAELAAMRLQVTALQAEVRVSRYLPPCPACKKPFDLLVNHYSIGLFDNLVYVKCPHCNKAMPVVDDGVGGVRLVAE